MRWGWKGLVLGRGLGALGVWGFQKWSPARIGPSIAYAQQAATALAAQEGLMVRADELSTAFRSVAKALKPSVVRIEALVERPTQRGQVPMAELPPMFRDFFGDQFDFEMPENQQGESLGSGVIVTQEGHILTNHHVVNGATKLEVTLSDDRKLPAKLVGSDPDSDIAVIQIQSEGLVVAPFGDSNQLEVGDWVVAIGSPFGLSQTVTSGIVSALNRGDRGITQYDDFIQTDAAINPGNSGGPLLNLRGQLIGINTAIASRSGAFNGIGFAIPSNTAKDALEDIIKTGHVVRGFIGLGLANLTEKLARDLGIDPMAKGVVVELVSEGGPAAKGNVQPGDFVTSINGQAVADISQLRLKIAAMSPGDIAELAVIRDGKEMTLRVEIEEQTKEKMVAMSNGRMLERLGIELAPISREEAEELNLSEEDGGVIVKRIDRNSPLAGQLMVGEAIVAVNRKRVRSPQELVAAINQAAAQGQPVRLTIRNPQSTRMLILQ
jgi:serine protease Do